MNANAIALDALKKIVENAEQSKFEDWLEAESPSGDVEQVQSQWENSGMYHAFCDKWADAFAAIAALEAEPQDGDVEQALNRMDALLDPSLNLLAVSEDSITLQGCRADMLTIRRALRMAPAAREGWQPIETAPTEQADLRQLMGMNEAEIDAELLAAGISPDDAVKRADRAIKGALATVRAERRLDVIYADARALKGQP